MKTSLKYRLLDYSQDFILWLLIWRDRCRRFFRPQPRSFWDL
jgi:hypothetical protein